MFLGLFNYLFATHVNVDIWILQEGRHSTRVVFKCGVHECCEASRLPKRYVEDRMKRGYGDFNPNVKFFSLKGEQKRSYRIADVNIDILMFQQGFHSFGKLAVSTASKHQGCSIALN